MKTRSTILAFLIAFLPASGKPVTNGNGQVQLPIERYENLVDTSRTPIPVPPPTSYALGKATVIVGVTETEGRATATVETTLALRVLDEGWVGIPVLPAGTAVNRATVGGSEVELATLPEGLVYGTKDPGSYQMRLAYRVDAIHQEGGFVLPIPVPAASSIALTATLPESGLDVSVIPAVGTHTSGHGASTVVTATVPTTRGIQLAWHERTKLSHAIGRAVYQGTLDRDSLTLTADYDVELFTGDTVTLPLLPTTTTLRNISLDGKDAAIVIESGSYATLLKGRGKHTVTVRFEAPVNRKDGPPRVSLAIPRVPVSRFDITLPGKKDLTVTPSARVATTTKGESTLATIFVPMTESVTFGWAEAVPEEIRTEFRANAAVYHAVHAEEGVLSIRALIRYEVTRGETSTVTIETPADVSVNKITSPSGAVSDWRLAPPNSSGARNVTVFLNRAVKGELLLDVLYDRSLKENESVPLPLLKVAGTERQRGMAALLQSRELTLSPVEEGGAVRVGENQLPAFVHDAIEMTVAHTFKYMEEAPKIVVAAKPPERKQGRFDAEIDTLVSLGEVTLRGQASIELNVKSGGIEELFIALPGEVNLLSLTGPSIRNHTAKKEGAKKRIAIQFTQEMKGQFRLEMSYEQILNSQDEILVPVPKVEGPDVEQGRIAVEARSALEVKPKAAEQLTALDINELPRQLVLRTTNPILLAYKYVHAEPPPALTLKVTRHKVVEVQKAAIDQADYKTLFTRDGLSVTTATFTVRNSRKQFLRVKLPAGSTIWSASVDGKPEKPALGEEKDTFLVKIVTSTRGFPVRLVYATKASRIGNLGSVKAALPQPEILVTHTRWDVYLPDKVAYGKPRTNMTLAVAGVRQGLAAMKAEQQKAARRDAEPLRLSIPATGIHFAFEKLYANQGKEDSWFRVTYVTRAGATLGLLLTLLGALSFWTGLLALVIPRLQVGRRIALLLAVAGALILVITIGGYGASLTPAVLVSLAALAILAFRLASKHWSPASIMAKLRREPPLPWNDVDEAEDLPVDREPGDAGQSDVGPDDDKQAASEDDASGPAEGSEPKPDPEKGPKKN